MGNLKDLRHRADLTVAGFYILCITIALSIWQEIRVYKMAHDIAGGIAFNQAAAGDLDTLSAIVELARRGLAILITITFLAWFYRAYKNLVSASVLQLRYSPIWTVVGFFIPLACFVIPYQVMVELWKGSFVVEDEALKENWKDRPLSGNVVSWWALFVTSMIGGSIAAQYSLHATTPDSIFIGIGLTILFDIVDIAAAIFTILVIREITARQSKAIDLQVATAESYAS